jgi:hypothetical protein
MVFERHDYMLRAFVWLVSFTRQRPVFETHTQTDELHKLIDTANPTELSELEFVERMARPNRTIENVKMATKMWITLHLLRAAYCCYLMLVEYNIISRASRLAISNDESTGQQLYSFACITSNCSTLFDPLVNATRSQLIMDELPIFATCQPLLARFNEPQEHMSLFGVYTMIINACSWPIILIMLSELARVRSRNPHLLFLAAPNISRRLNFLRTKEHAEELQRSFLQYQQMIWTKRFTYNPSGSSSSHLDVYEPQSSVRRTAKSKACSKSNQAQTPQWDYLSWEKHRFVYDCFPLIRFEEWRRRVGYVVLLFISSVAAIAIAVMISFCWTANVHFDEKRLLMVEIQSEANRTGCKLWHKRTGGQLDLAGLQYGFGAYGVISLCVSTSVPIWLSLLPIVAIVMNSWDLRCLICELKYKIIMLLPVIKNMTDAMLREQARFESRHQRSYLDGHNRLEYTLREVGGGQQVTNEFKYGKLREKFVKDVRAIPLALLNRPFLSHRLRLETQVFIMKECLDDRFKSAVDLTHWPTTLAELLEKLYVEFRILDDLMTEAHPCISVVTGTAAILCYLVALITLTLCKLSEVTFLLHYLTIFACFFGAIALTLSSAQVLCRLAPLADHSGRAAGEAPRRVSHSRRSHDGGPPEHLGRHGRLSSSLSCRFFGHFAYLQELHFCCIMPS